MERRYGVQIHHMMALCGGFFGVYAVINRMGVFGSAQTSNLIELVCDFLGRDPMEISLRVLALVFYGAAMVLYVALEKKTSWNLEYTAIAIDLAVAAVMGLIPAEVNPFVALYPVFFATAFQWCTFTGAKGYVSATIFSTNNLKQTVTSFADYLLSGKRRRGGRRSWRRPCSTAARCCISTWVWPRATGPACCGGRGVSGCAPSRSWGRRR